jgi:hypothetical protein
VLRLEQALKESKAEGKQWLGPIRSAYGLHYVWLEAFERARDAELQEVERQLRYDLEYAAKKHALQCSIIARRNDYEIRGAKT